MEGSAAFKKNVHTAAVFLKSLNGVPEEELYTVGLDLTVNKCRHVRVKGAHKLFRALHDSYVHTQLSEVFGKLKTDKAAACQNCGCGVILIDVVFYAESVLNCPESEKLI